MKKELSMLLVSLSLMFMPTLAYAGTELSPNFTSNSVQRTPFSTNTVAFVGYGAIPQVYVNPIMEKRRYLEEKIQSQVFSQSPLEVRLNNLNEFFDLQSKIHSELKKESIKSNDLTRIEEIEGYIRLESRNSQKSFSIISELFLEMVVKPGEERQKYIKQVSDVLTSIKNSRTSSVEAYAKIISKKQTLQIGQKTSLLKMAELSLQSEKKDKALEAYSKISSMQQGDAESLIEISKLVEGEKNDYLFFNHNLLHIDKNLIDRNGKWYLPISEINKLSGFQYQENIELKTRVIEAENHSVMLQDDHLTVDGVTLGTPLLFYVEDGQTYIDFGMMLGFFSYEMKKIEAIDMIYITKPLFEKSELDVLNIDQLLQSFF
jgi:hypothetical protein